MNMRNVNRISKALLGLFLFGIPSAAMAAPGPGKVPSASRVSPSKPLDLTSLVLNKVFASIGRPNFQSRISFSFGSKGKELNELNGKVQLPFSQAIAGIPLVSRGTSEGSSEIDEIAPVLDINTKDLVVQWNVNTFREKGRLVVSNFIQFNTKSGRGTTLVGTVHSPLAEYLQISISSVRIDIEEGEEDGKFEVEGKCDSSQSVVEISTGKVGTIPVVCKLSGYVNTDKKDHGFTFIYDSTGR